MSLIIFGWGKTTVKNAGQVGPRRCARCNNQTMWALSRVKSWFSLFFIPIIPYRTEYLMLCPICGNGVKLSNKQFYELKDEAGS
jgi:hypothetical protein